MIELDHSVAELSDLDEPGRHRPVDERIAAPPAVRIGVIVGFMPDQYRPVDSSRSGPVLEVLDDQRVGVEDQLALVVRHGHIEPTSRIDRGNRDDVDSVGGGLVILAVGRCHVHDPGAVLCGDEVAPQHLE